MTKDWREALLNMAGKDAQAFRTQCGMIPPAPTKNALGPKVLHIGSVHGRRM